jgi:glycosyltransferase involved in cell wall biosynthesis
MMHDLVSVMMPAYNAEHFIGQAIESVVAQTYPHWELIIVNDGSSDRTGEVALRYADPRICVLHKPNGGEASARNLALSQMMGTLVAFLDADDEFLPDHLEAAVNYLEIYPNRGGVYTDGYYVDGADQRLGRLSQHRRGPFEGDIFEQVVRASDVFGPPICTVLRRDKIAAHQLAFDTSIRIGPDWDFLTRYAEVAEFGFLTQATCLYRVHQTNVTVTTQPGRRKLSIARCREKAIKLTRFRQCSVETRAYAFYDLLVNLLTGFPERQTAISEWPEFKELPAREQARLLRLMASQAILHGDSQLDAGEIRSWLQRAQKLNPADLRGWLLSNLYQLSPPLCQRLLRTRQAVQSPLKAVSPFGQLD